MEAMKNSGQTWQHRLSTFLLAYHNTSHTVPINVSPGSKSFSTERAEDQVGSPPGNYDQIV